MARTTNGDAMEQDSDNSISLASTALSEEQSQYGIDGGILAERQVDGEMQYLVKWEGYDEHRNTWEPEENFQSGDTLKEWREKKMRVTRGLEKPFNVDAFEERKEAIMKATAARKYSRRFKRKRHGIEVEPSSESSGSESSDSHPRLKSAKIKQGAFPGTAFTAATRDTVEKPRSRRSSVQGKPPTLWTDQERRALEAGGFRANGPFWDTVLTLYGPNGTVNQDLRHKTQSDLQKMAFVMKKEFLGIGRDPPDWLKNIKSGKLEKSPPKSQGRSTGVASGGSPHDDISGPSAMTISSPKSSGNTSPAMALLKQSTYKGTARAPTASELAGLKAFKVPSESDVSKSTGRRPSTGATSDGAAGSVAAEPYKGTLKPDTSKSVAHQPYSGTARPAPSGPLRSDTARGSSPHISASSSAQMGIRGAGPARRQPKTPIRSPKKKKAVIKKRDGLKANPDDPQSFKPFKNLAHQNRAFQMGRNEPAPNLDNLVFIDPRTGKPPRLQPPQSPLRSGPLAARVLTQQNSISGKDARGKGILSPKAPIGALDVSTDTPTSGKEAGAFPNPLAAIAKFRPDEQFEADANIMMGSTPVAARKHITKIPSKGKTEGTKLFHPPLGPSIARGDSLFAQRYSPAGINLMRDSTRTMKLDLHQRREAAHSLVFGNLKYGIQGQDLPEIRLQGLDKEVKALLLTVKLPPTTVHFELKKTCLAAEFQFFFPCDPSEFTRWGYVVPAPWSFGQIDCLADRLAHTLSGALCFARLFTMVIYPVGSDAWSFLDRALPEVPEGALLRFVVIDPLPGEFAENEVPGLSSWIQEDSDRYKQMAVDVPAQINEPKTKNIIATFKEMYGIEYSRLFARQKPIFFLCFIPVGCESYEKDPVKRQALRVKTSEEHDFFLDFLQANGAEVYSMQERGSTEPAMNGSWDCFANSSKSGVIVVHDACTRIDQFQSPRLVGANVLNRNFWKLSLEPMRDGARDRHLIRLFPHGGVILLTESLMLYQPWEALRILMWFRLVQLPERTPGSWKLAVRLHARSWLLDILDLYEDTKSDVFGCGKQVFGDLYTNITWLLESAEPPFELMCYEWDNETPDDNAPLVAPAYLRGMHDRKEWIDDGSGIEIDHDNIKFNDDLLVQWFAEWATVACEDFRRFQVVLGYDAKDTHNSPARKYEKTWGHVEIMTAEACFKSNGVRPQANLDALEAKRLDNMRTNAPLIQERIVRKRRQAQETAKASLDRIKRMYREMGANEKQIRDGARIHLKQTGASSKEIEDAQIDVERSYDWTKPDATRFAPDRERVKAMEAMLAQEQTEAEAAARQRKKALRQGGEKAKSGTRGGGYDGVDDDPMDTSDAPEASKIAAPGRVVEDAVARSIRLARQFPASGGDGLR